MNLNPYHAWLVRQRRYCEHPGCLMEMRRATHVVKFNGRDEVRCDWHSMGPLQQGYERRAKGQDCK